MTDYNNDSGFLAKPKRGPSGPDNRDVQLRPQVLLDLKFPAHLSQVLALSRAKAVFKFSGTGKQANIVDIDSKQIISSAEEMKSIFQLDKIVNDCKKRTVSDMWRLQLSLFVLRAKIPSDQFPGYTEELYATLKPWFQNLKVLDDNIVMIQELQLSTGHELRKSLINQSVKISQVIEEFMKSLITGSKEKKIFPKLLTAGIPVWIYQKLISKNLAFNSVDFYRFYFPSNPVKGITLTVEEINTDLILKEMESLIKESTGLISLVKHKDIVALSGIELARDRLEEEAFMKSKVYLVAPKAEFERVLRTYKAVNFKGIPLPDHLWNGKPDTFYPCLSSIFLQILHLQYQRPDPKTDFFGKICKDPLKPFKEGVNYYAQTSAQYDADEDAVPIMQMLNLKCKQDTLIEWISTTLALSKEGSVKLSSIIKEPKHILDTEISVKKILTDTILTVPIKPTGFAKPTPEEQLTTAEIFKKGRNSKPTVRNPKQILSKEGEKLILQISKQYSQFLAMEVSSFLRSLPNEQVMDTMVRLAKLKVRDIVSEARFRDRKRIDFDPDEGGGDIESDDDEEDGEIEATTTALQQVMAASQGGAEIPIVMNQNVLTDENSAPDDNIWDNVSANQAD
jgi:hypothetical protein